MNTLKISEKQHKCTRKRWQPQKICVHQFVQIYAENVVSGASQNTVNAWAVLQKILLQIVDETAFILLLGVWEVEAHWKHQRNL